MKKIDVSTKKYPNTFALVDDEDYEKLNKYKWHAPRQRSGTYAVRDITVDGKRKRLHMHRQVIGYIKGMVVDHINHDCLDNRKENLRLCTHTQNCMNRLSNKNSSSQYKGVYFHKSSGHWQASIRVSTKLIHLGTYRKEIDAAKVYNENAVRYFKEFANVNILEGIG